MTPSCEDDARAAGAIAAIESAVVACTRCPELIAYVADVARAKRREYRDWTYWGRPVPAFGDPGARLALVGLAPGAHGSNRTGRMFTGDASGVWLYRALHRAGFATSPDARDRDDGLRLIDCFITAALRCAPPGNKPTPAELARCAPYLDAELQRLPRLEVIVGLGAIGTRAAVRSLQRLGFVVDNVPFRHGATWEARLPAGGDVRRIQMISSYHPSRQNTNTRKLTEPMLDAIFAAVRTLSSGENPPSAGVFGAPEQQRRLTNGAGR